jgi:DNA methylase
MALSVSRSRRNYKSLKERQHKDLFMSGDRRNSITLPCSEIGNRCRTILASTRTTQRIRLEIKRSKGDSEDYWDFKDSKKEGFEDSLFQYPAMMVPAMQREVIGAILKARPKIKTMADPFVGSGTILVQALLAGKSFIGQDINPLALLISKTRAYCLNHKRLSLAKERLWDRVNKDNSQKYAKTFFNQAKWFTKGASIALSRLYRGIICERDYNTRLFLWTCLAETVRNKSNSRTSTFKLHIRPPEERCAIVGDVIGSFFAIADDNVEKVRNFADSLSEKKLLAEDFTYKHAVKLVYGDSATSLPSPSLLDAISYDLVVTSPPYGDNKTTVPYGQSAWLPLQWVDLADIDSRIPTSVIESMYCIDNQSLGGRILHSNKKEEFKGLVDRIKAIGSISNKVAKELELKHRDGISRYSHFIHDLSKVITLLAANCTEESHLVWTLGHRTIRGVDCPLTDIVAELFKKQSIDEIARIHRRIQSKRIPSKNSVSKTIAEEFILILRANHAAT